MGQMDEALAIWADLSDQASDATLQAFARTALNQLSWPAELLSALSTVDLAEAARALDRWLSSLTQRANWGCGSWFRALSSNPRTLHRLVPLLERRMQQQPLGCRSGVAALSHQRCVPRRWTALIRLSPTAFLVSWLPSRCRLDRADGQNPQWSLVFQSNAGP